MKKKKKTKTKKNKKIKNKEKFLLIHPIIFTIYPVLFLFAYNIKEAYLGNIYKPLIISIAFSTILFFIINILIKDIKKTAIILSSFLFMFFSYGHIYNLLQNIKINNFQVFNHIVLFTIFILLFEYIVMKILQLKKEINLINNYLNYFSLVLIILVIFNIGYGLLNYHKTFFKKYNLKNAKKIQTNYPDIYYIILDGHGRQDILKEIYGYDDSFFINGLKKMGFFIADKGRTNYCQTFLSLSSSLNMNYLDEFIKNKKPEMDSRIFLGELIRHNKVVDFLKEHNYTYITFFTGFVGTELKGFADIYLPDKLTIEDITEFDNVFLNTTILKAIFSFINLNKKKKIGLHIAFRRRTLYILKTLPEVAKFNFTKFVFVHILQPHPPFVFDANGPTDKYVGTAGVKFVDGSQNPIDKKVYLKAYREQAKFIDKEILKVVKYIIKNSKKTPIIILQGDHGPGAHWDADNYEKTNLKERFSILNAYLLPDGGEKLLYPDISPVNTFRIILNYYFNQNLPLLKDKSFYSTWKEPLKFIKVPDSILLR